MFSLWLLIIVDDKIVIVSPRFPVQEVLFRYLASELADPGADGVVDVASVARGVVAAQRIASCNRQSFIRIVI